MPRDPVSRTGNVVRNGGHKWVNASKLLKFLIHANDTRMIQRSKKLSTFIDMFNIELSKVAKWFAVASYFTSITSYFTRVGCMFLRTFR